MNQTSVTYRQDWAFHALLRDNKFSWGDGALAYFHNVYESQMFQDAEKGDYFFLRKCIALHIKASNYYMEGSFFKKLQALLLSSKAAQLADLLKEKIPNDELTSEDCYLLIASQVVLINSHLVSLFGSSKVISSKTRYLQSLVPSFFSRLDFLIAGEQSKGEGFSPGRFSTSRSYFSSDYFLSTKYPDLLTTTVLSQQKICIEMMLFKLSVVGLHVLPDQYTTRERLFAYAMFHEKSQDINLLKIVSEIFQALSKIEAMKKVNILISSYDNAETVL